MRDMVLEKEMGMTNYELITHRIELLHLAMMRCNSEGMMMIWRQKWIALTEKRVRMELGLAMEMV